MSFFSSYVSLLSVLLELIPPESSTNIGVTFLSPTTNTTPSHFVLPAPVRGIKLSSVIIQQQNSVPSHSITELRSLRDSLGELVEVQRLLNPVFPVTQVAPFPKPYVRPPTVPTQLPFFQWVVHVYDDTRTAFPTLKACVRKLDKGDNASSCQHHT